MEMLEKLTIDHIFKFSNIHLDILPKIATKKIFHKNGFQNIFQDNQHQLIQMTQLIQEIHINSLKPPVKLLDMLLLIKMQTSLKETSDQESQLMKSNQKKWIHRELFSIASNKK